MLMTKGGSRRFFVELIGTIFLVLAVMGSSHVADTAARLQPIFVLLVTALATGGVLLVLVAVFQNLSGAHFNPAVTLSLVITRDIDWHDGVFYVIAHILGALLAVALFHVMFDIAPLYSPSNQERLGLGLWMSEMLFTFGLVFVIHVALRRAQEKLPVIVASFVGMAIVSSSSEAFINPAITMARMFTTSVSGIDATSAVPFMIFQCLGAVLAALVILSRLAPPHQKSAQK